MGKVILLQVDGEISARLCRDAGVMPDVSFDEVDVPERLLGQLKDAIHDVDTLVLGASVGEPIRLAQQVQALDEDLEVLILSHPDRSDHLRRALQFSPFIGNEVSCRSTAEGEALASMLIEAVMRTRQRRRHRATLAAAQARLTAAGSRPRRPVQILDQLLNIAPIGVITVGESDSIAAWNWQAGDILGWRGEAKDWSAPIDEAGTDFAFSQMMLGTPLSHQFPESERERLVNLINRCSTSDKSSSPEIFERKGCDGSHFVEITAAAIDGHTGELEVMVLIQDVTARVRAEEERAQLLVRERSARAKAEASQQRLDFLFRAMSTMLENSLDYVNSLGKLAQITVPTIADWSAVDIVDENQSVQRLAVVHTDPTKVESVYELVRRYPTDPDAPRGVSNVLRTGEAEIYPEIPDALLVESARDAEHLLMMRELGLKSALVVPLVARGQTLGAITLVAAESGRHYGPEDLTLAEDLAQRVALVIDNARLFQEAQKLNLSLEQHVTELKKEIADRVRAEERLRESEEKYHNLYNTAPDMFASVEPQTAIIKQCNQTLATNLGYTKEELIGSPIFDMYHPDCLEDAKKAFESFVKTGVVRNAELQLKRKDGTKIDVILNVSAVRDEQGKILYSSSVFRDITDRKHLELERERLLETLEEKNRELEQIVYVASHDLRSPLVNVQGFGQELGYACEALTDMLENEEIPPKLREQCSRLLQEDISESLNFIQASAAKMDALLTGLLKLSRLGRAALDIRPLDMNLILSQVAQTFEFQIQQAGATLEIEDLPPCNGDAIQMNQVFSNLIDNALKYLDVNRLGRISVGGYQQGNQSIYYVKDNGIGILDQYQAQIFEIFHRLRSDESPGEGLGLTIVRKSLERHRGKIWLASKPGEGSTFFVSIPHEKQAEMALQGNEA